MSKSIEVTSQPSTQNQKEEKSQLSPGSSNSLNLHSMQINKLVRYFYFIKLYFSYMSKAYFLITSRRLSFFSPMK